MQLAKNGANVVLAARREDKLAKLVEDIKAIKGAGDAVAVTLDVGAGGDAVSTAVDTAWQSFGRIDIVLNNAGT